MSRKEYIVDAIRLIDEYLEDPIECIDRYNAKKGIYNRMIRIDVENDKDLLSLIQKDEKSSVVKLSEKLDLINKSFVNKIQKRTIVENEIEYKYTPLKRVGIYIPFKMPSSAYTYLSAAKAAGISEICLYLAQSSSGEIDPLSYFVGKLYGATVITGPSRLGFPILTFGIKELGIAPNYMICGPCGERLNILKQVCSILGGVSTDFFAGPSDLTIITDGTTEWTRIYKSIISQLEHGKDSSAKLFIIGSNNYDYWKSYLKNKQIQLEGVQVKCFEYIENLTDEINNIASESMEIWMESIPNNFIEQMSSGVIYMNNVSSLGDYGAIGRGCADPTNYFARSQSGLTPLTFLKITPVVIIKNIKDSLIRSAEKLANYEGLHDHMEAIKHALENN